MQSFTETSASQRRPMASTMQGREFPRQSMKSNLISMLQQSDSSVFSPAPREIFPKKPGEWVFFRLSGPGFGQSRRNYGEERLYW